MSYMDAWKWIVDNWGSATWLSIPIQVRNTLHLDVRLGVCHYGLVTQSGAKGINDFVTRMNERKPCLQH